MALTVDWEGWICSIDALCSSKSYRNGDDDVEDNDDDVVVHVVFLLQMEFNVGRKNITRDKIISSNRRYAEAKHYTWRHIET